MDWWRGLLRRLRVLARRNAVERELDDEVQLHIELETAAGQQRGLSAAAARREALRSFGSVDRFTDEARDARGLNLLDELGRDTRHALRVLARSPQFTLAAVLTLALGIGANTAIFSVVNAVLLRASPFAQPDRLVMIWETDRASNNSHEPASWPDVADMRERSRTFESIGTLTAVAGTLTGSGDPERVSAVAVTPNLPDVLGVRALFGRTFRAGEGALNAPRVALLSEEFWRRRFAGDRGIIGSSITVNGRPSEVLGVLQAESDLGLAQVHARADYSAPLSGSGVDVWIAVEPTAQAFPRSTHPWLTVGRLQRAATLSAGQQELAGIMTDLERNYPENAARGVNLEPYAHVTFGPVRPALLVLMGAVLLVLLVACVNVANLLLARTAARAREVALRRALGAAMGRLVRQFLVESLALTMVGAAAGVVLAYGGLAVLIALAPPDIPRLAAVNIDMRVLGFTAVVAIVVAIAFSLLPVLQARRLDLQSVLKVQPGRRVSEGREGRRFRGALVVAEVGLAVTLVIGAGVLLRSFWALSAVDPGFRTERVLKVEYQLPGARYPAGPNWPNWTEINTFHAELERRVSSLPGVVAAGVAARHPLDPGITNSFTVIGREAEAHDWPEIRTRFISPGYLETVGLPLLTGRAIAAGDVTTGTRVGLINRMARERYFPNTDPIGQQLNFWGVSWQVAGVVGNERFNGVDEDTEPAIYVPLGQAPQGSAVLLLRTTADPQTLIPSVRRVFNELDPQLALFAVEPLDRTLAASIARPRFTAMLLALFGGVAILLAMIGVHGVLSYTVGQRAPEVGIRMALGATRTEVIGLVVREGALLAGLGTMLGLAGALAGSQLLSKLVFGVSARDTTTFAVVTLAVLIIAGFAAWLPARRAARADPMQSLRAE